MANRCRYWYVGKHLYLIDASSFSSLKFAASRPDLIKSAIYIEAFGIMTRPADDLPKLMGKSLSTPLVQPDSKIYPTWDGIIQRYYLYHVLYKIIIF